MVNRDVKGERLKGSEMLKNQAIPVLLLRRRGFECCHDCLFHLC